MQAKKLTAAALLGLFSSAASAVPFMTMDPRALGMGGTGVSSGTSANASFYNPALLAAARLEEDFSLEIPAVSVRVSDPDDLNEAITDASDKNYFENYENARNALLSPSPPPNALTDFRNATVDMLDGMRSFSNKTIEADLTGNIVIGVPSRKTGIAVTAGGWVSGSAVGDFTQQDDDALQSIITAIDNNTLIPANTLSPDQYTSNIQLQGIFAKEIGISLAREFDIFNREVAIGITPKVIQATTVDFTYVANELDNADVGIDEGTKNSTGFTMDLGLARDYGNGWKTGLAVKNVIPQSYDTVKGNKINVDPAARVGVSYYTSRANIALDLDLTENAPTALGGKTQYAGIGAEVDVWVLLLRLGYRYNIANADTSIATVGLGLNLLGLHVDIGAGLGSNEIAAAAQLGFRF